MFFTWATILMGAFSILTFLKILLTSSFHIPELSHMPHHDHYIGDLEKGARRTILVDNRPIFIWHRTPKDIEDARSIKAPEPTHKAALNWQVDEKRTHPKFPQWLVLDGQCNPFGGTARGNEKFGWQGDLGGWYCVHSMVHYDKSGRYGKGPHVWFDYSSLKIPSYYFVDDKTIRFLFDDRDFKYIGADNILMVTGHR